MTQNGSNVWLQSNTHAKGLNSDTAVARRLLANFLSKHAVEFVPCDPAVLEPRVAGSVGVTDLYRADLASRRGMTLATLDTGIVHPAVDLV